MEGFKHRVAGSLSAHFPICTCGYRASNEEAMEQHIRTQYKFEQRLEKQKLINEKELEVLKLVHLINEMDKEHPKLSDYQLKLSAARWELNIIKENK